MRIFSILLIMSNVFANNNINPCMDPILSLANKNGLKSLTFKEVLYYRKISRMCKKQGGKEKIRQIVLREYNRDFENSRYMSSWTSTHSMFVSMLIFYYLMGLMYSSKPNK